MNRNLAWFKRCHELRYLNISTKNQLDASWSACWLDRSAIPEETGVISNCLLLNFSAYVTASMFIAPSRDCKGTGGRCNHDHAVFPLERSAFTASPLPPHMYPSKEEGCPDRGKNVWFLYCHLHLSLHRPYLIRVGNLATRTLVSGCLTRSDPSPQTLKTSKRKENKGN